jgi:uncharacterized membrane protein
MMYRAERRGVLAIAMLPVWVSISGCNHDAAMASIESDLKQDSFSESGNELTTACTFHGVGIAPGRNGSIATSVSGDGTFIVGNDIDVAGRRHAFRLDLRNGQRNEIASGDGRSTYAESVSTDGYAIVGLIGNSPEDGFGFRWTEDRGLDLLGVVRDDTASVALDVSADGNVVVGRSFIAGAWFEAGHAVLYRAGQPKPMEIEGLDQAISVSADGQFVFGNIRLPEELLLAALWTDGLDQPEPIALEPGGSQMATAVAISSDGSTLLMNYCEAGCLGARSQGGGGVIEPLMGLLAASNLNGDGSIAMGATDFDGSGACSGGGAAIWREEVGFAQAIACDLLPPGAIPRGWVLDEVHAASDDGTVLVGTGKNPALQDEGWVAILGPECDG